MEDKFGSHKDILVARYSGLADSIALLFSGFVEVIIHDLGSQSVVYIANNFSKRVLGDPAALDDIEFDPNENVIGPYEKLNWDGRKIRSVSNVLRDDAGMAIGVLCINFNVSGLETARDTLTTLLSGVATTPKPEKLFHDDWQERINIFIHRWLAENQLTLSILTRGQKRELVEALYVNGAFKGKNTPDYVANILNLSRATVFKYLKTLKAPDS